MQRCLSHHSSQRPLAAAGVYTPPERRPAAEGAVNGLSQAGGMAPCTDPGGHRLQRWQPQLCVHLLILTCCAGLMRSASAYTDPQEGAYNAGCSGVGEGSDVTLFSAETVQSARRAHLAGPGLSAQDVDMPICQHCGLQSLRKILRRRLKLGLPQRRWRLGTHCLPNVRHHRRRVSRPLARRPEC